MWTSQVLIFEDEDEEALKSAFVELSARYSDYPAFAVAQEVFKNQVDPEARANQAALVWGNALDIKERIRKAKDNKGVEPKELSEEVRYLMKCESEANNESNPATVRYKWFELAAKMRGFIKDTAEPGKSADKVKKFPTFVAVKYDD